MSDITKSKEQKTTTINKYTVAVLIDNQLQESFALEGIGDHQRAGEGFFRWYLFHRSKNFPFLKRDDIDVVMETFEQNNNLPEHSEAVASFSIEVTNPEDSTFYAINVKILLSPFVFATMYV